MEAEFRALLTGDAAIAALLTFSGGLAIYWDEIPQNAPDKCVVLYPIGEMPDYHMQGPSGLEDHIVQINVRALKVTDVWAVIRALKAKLNGVSLQQGSVLFKSIRIVGNGRLPSVDTGTNVYVGRRIDIAFWTASAS